MQSITTITTFVPVVDDTEIQRQLRKLGEREEDLVPGVGGNAHDKI